MAFLPHEDAAPPDIAQSSFCLLPVMQLETVCCTSMRASLGTLAAVDVLQLRDTPLVLFGSSFFHTQNLLDRFAAQQLSPKILLQTDQLSTIHRLVADDLAVGFLFRQIADTLPDIRSVPLHPAMPVNVSLFWRRDLPMTQRMPLRSQMYYELKKAPLRGGESISMIHISISGRISRSDFPSIMQLSSRSFKP